MQETNTLFSRCASHIARSADDGGVKQADTMDLDPGRAVAEIRRMRERFKRTGMSAQRLLLELKAAGLTETVDILRPHVASL